MSHTFLHDALIYLAAAIVFVPIAKKLGMGSVLGYLLARNHHRTLLSRFYWRRRKRHHALCRIRRGDDAVSDRAGAGTVPFLGNAQSHSGNGLLTGMCNDRTYFSPFFCSWDSAGRLRLSSGLALSMSSTAIVMQTLREKGLTQTESGKRSFAVLLFQDISVIPVLALLPLLALSTVHTSCGTCHAPGGIARMGANDRVVGCGGADDPERSPCDCPFSAVYWPHPFAGTFYGSGAINRDRRGVSDGAGRPEPRAGGVPGGSRPGQQRIPPRTGERH